MKSYIVHVTETSTQRYLVEAEDAAGARQAIVEGGGLRMFPIQHGEIQVDFAGDWNVEEYRPAPETEFVDLKWALWSRDRDEWDTRKEGFWSTLENMAVGESYEISTAPGKEIRYGVVNIQRTDDGYDADVHFRSVWDSVESLCDTEDVDDEYIEMVREIAPHACGEPGVEFGATLTGVPDLKTLMMAIDDVEAELLEKELEAWMEFERQMKAIAEAKKEPECQD